MTLFGRALKWDIHHTMFAIGSPMAAALVTYLSSKDPGSIIDAMGSWQTAKPMLLGAAVAELTTLLALAKQTFVAPTAPTGGATAGGNPDAVNRGGVPRAPGMFRMWSTRALACVMLAAFTMTAAGCAAVSQWWQDLEQNPSATIGAFVQYVQGFVATAQTIWALLAPMLGANSAQATADFSKAVVTLQDSLAALQDGVQAAAIAKNPNPDFSALTAAVQDAVAKVVAIVQQWETASSSGLRVSEAHSSLVHQAQSIAHWKVKP